MSKETQIQKLAEDMLNEAIPHIKAKIAKALRSGAIDVDGWDENSNPMVLPKIVLVAAMEDEAEQYNLKGTGFEKEATKEIKNIKLFL